MKIGHGDTLVCTGDSITDTGRARPVGERAGLGTGYVSMVNALMESVYPERRIRILNTGISGNRVTDLDTRWQTDVLELQPNWVSILIGINDVWRHFDHAANPRQVDKDKYERVYRTLIERTQPHVKGLILMAPYFVEPHRSDPMRKMMDEYGVVVRKLAGEYKTLFTDVQAGFDEYLKHRPTQSVCGDRVHVNITGHMIICRCLLNAIGFEWKGASKKK